MSSAIESVLRIGLNVSGGRHRYVACCNGSLCPLASMSLAAHAHSGIMRKQSAGARTTFVHRDHGRIVFGAAAVCARKVSLW